MLMTDRATSRISMEACFGLDLTHAHALGYKTTAVNESKYKEHEYLFDS